MTQIIEVSGLEKRRYAPDSYSDRGIADEKRQRAALVKRLSPVDIGSLSEGEMHLYLQGQYAKMMSEYYQGTAIGAVHRDEYLGIRDVLHNGLHSSFGLSHLEQRFKTAPASRWMSWQQKGFSPDGGIPYLYDDAGDALRGIGSLDIEECMPKLMTQIEWLYENYARKGKPAPSTSQQIVLYNAYKLATQKEQLPCLRQNAWNKVMNERFPATGHHALYNFITNPNAAPNLVATKSVLHSIAIEVLAVNSRVSYQNLSNWQRNGIVAKNISANAGPLTPAETIMALKMAHDDGIGEPTTAVVIAIITAIAGAIGAATALINAIKGVDSQAANNFEAESKGYSKQKWGPEKVDWDGDGEVDDCPPGSHLENGECFCDDGSYWDTAASACLPNDDGGSFSLGNNGLLIGGGLLLGALLLSGDGKKK